MSIPLPGPFVAHNVLLTILAEVLDVERTFEPEKVYYFDPTNCGVVHPPDNQDADDPLFYFKHFYFCDMPAFY